LLETNNFREKPTCPVGVRGNSAVESKDELFHTIWYPRQESNLQLLLRRESLYPFNYEGKIGFFEDSTSPLYCAKIPLPPLKKKYFLWYNARITLIMFGFKKIKSCLSAKKSLKRFVFKEAKESHAAETAAPPPDDSEIIIDSEVIVDWGALGIEDPDALDPELRELLKKHASEAPEDLEAGNQERVVVGEARYRSAKKALEKGKVWLAQLPEGEIKVEAQKVLGEVEKKLDKTRSGLDGLAYPAEWDEPDAPDSPEKQKAFSKKLKAFAKSFSMKNLAEIMKDPETCKSFLALGLSAQDIQNVAASYMQFWPEDASTNLKPVLLAALAKVKPNEAKNFFIDFSPTKLGISLSPVQIVSIFRNPASLQNAQTFLSALKQADPKIMAIAIKHPNALSNAMAHLTFPQFTDLIKMMEEAKVPLDHFGTIIHSYRENYPNFFKYKDKSVAKLLGNLDQADSSEVVSGDLRADYYELRKEYRRLKRGKLPDMIKLMVKLEQFVAYYSGNDKGQWSQELAEAHRMYGYVCHSTAKILSLKRDFKDMAELQIAQLLAVRASVSFRRAESSFEGLAGKPGVDPEGIKRALDKSRKAQKIKLDPSLFTVRGKTVEIKFDLENPDAATIKRLKEEGNRLVRLARKKGDIPDPQLLSRAAHAYQMAIDYIMDKKEVVAGHEDQLGRLHYNLGTIYMELGAIGRAEQAFFLANTNFRAIKEKELSLDADMMEITMRKVAGLSSEAIRQMGRDIYTANKGKEGVGQNRSTYQIKVLFKLAYQKALEQSNPKNAALAAYNLAIIHFHEDKGSAEAEKYMRFANQVFQKYQMSDLMESSAYLEAIDNKHDIKVASTEKPTITEET
jgi:hypothetical protein